MALTGWALIVLSPGSNEAAHYDAKHERAATEIIKRIVARKDFIGVSWVEDSDDEDSGDDDPREMTGQEEAAAAVAAVAAKSVRLLDYACGTGAISRVINSSHHPPPLCLYLSLSLLPLIVIMVHG